MSSPANNQYIYTRVWEIYETLHPKPDDLLSTSRFFVREDEMQLWDEKKKKKKKRYFFLFNDILLMCRKEGRKRFWLRIHITLRSPHVNVENIENASFNNEFRLHCRSRSFIIYAVSPELRKDWIQDLQNSISCNHPEEKKDSKGNDDDTKKEDKKDVTKIKKEKGATAKKESKKAKHESDEEDSPEFEEEQEQDPPARKSTKESEETKQRSQNKSGTKKNKKKGQKKEGDDLLPPIVAFDPFGPNPNANNQQRAQPVNPFGQTGGMTGGMMVTTGAQNPFLPASGGLASGQMSNQGYPFGGQPQGSAFGSTGQTTAFGSQGVPFNNTGNFGASGSVAPFSSPSFQAQSGVSAQPVNPFMAQGQSTTTTTINPFGANTGQSVPVVNPFGPSVGNQTFGSTYTNPTNNPLF